MSSVSMCQVRPTRLWQLVLVVGLIATVVASEDYDADAVVEYRVRGATPVRWERGVIVRALDGGKQYLIREKPSQFFPEGAEIAYSPEELRRPAPESVNPGGAPAKSLDAGLTGVPGISQRPIAVGTGLLSEDDVVAYAQQVFGPGDPFANPRREALLAQIRDHIKSRGTSFQTSLDFKNRMWAIGAASVHIHSAIDANYGVPPKLEDYCGEFLLRTANRGSQSVTPSGSRVIITTTDAQHESGALTIRADRTYTWKVARDDPPSKWIAGRWREVGVDEMNLWEGGPAIWLEQARQGEDYMVRMCREPGWLDWIDVGMGAARTPVEYGRRSRE